MDPNESWLYLLPEGNLVFHFVAAGDVQDYKLVESLADVLGMDTALALQMGRVASSPRLQGLYESRVGLGPAYQRLAGRTTANRDRLMAAERTAGSRAIVTGTTTDSYARRYERAMGAVATPYVLGRAGGDGGELLVVFAIPGPSLAAAPVGDRMAYPIEMRLVAVRADGDAAAFLDTTRVFSTPRALQSNEHLTGHLSVPVPPGTHAVQLVLAQPSGNAGQVIRHDSVFVPDFGGDRLDVSDIIVGREGSGLQWARAGDTLDLSPLRRYPSASNLHVYYEVHGLARSAAYRARIEVQKLGGGSVFGWIKRLFGGGGPPIALRFEGVAQEPVTRVFQVVDISRLSPGQYRLRVEVEAADTGERVTRETRLEVVRS